MKVPNLLIIAGTGNKAGKTTMACRIIEKFRDRGVVAVKITPHFHETTPGLVPVIEKPGLSVYEEKNSNTTKDTSRMLAAGAASAFFAKVTDDTLPDAFLEILKHIPEGTPVVCESPALRYYFDPGLFIVMRSPVAGNQKDIGELLNFSHKEFTLSDISGSVNLPVGFSYGTWFSL